MTRFRSRAPQTSSQPLWLLAAFALLWVQWLGVAHHAAHALADVRGVPESTYGVPQQGTSQAAAADDPGLAAATEDGWIVQLFGHEPGAHCAAWDDATHAPAHVDTGAHLAMSHAPPAAPPCFARPAGFVPQANIPALGARAPPRRA